MFPMSTASSRLKFPAYLIPHQRKTLWVLHQFRQAYDLRDAGQSPLGNDPDSRAIVEAIHRADNECFAACRRIFTNSPVTQNRLRQYNRRKSEVLYPPLNDEALFRPGEYGDYIFAGGRVAVGKRQRMLIEAMKHTKSGVRLVIAGPPESDDIVRDLTELVERENLWDCVTLKLALLSREEIAGLANNARAAAYLPFDEDSLGYVTMEAFASGKAVLTTTDSWWPAGDRKTPADGVRRGTDAGGCGRGAMPSTMRRRPAATERPPPRCGRRRTSPGRKPSKSCCPEYAHLPRYIRHPSADDRHRLLRAVPREAPAGRSAGRGIPGRSTARRRVQ